MSETPRRRASDAEEAQEQRLINLFREEARVDRHAMREEIGVLVNELHLEIAGVKREVQAGNLADVTERATQAAAIAELRGNVKDLRGDVREIDKRIDDDLEPRIREVEAEQLAAHRVGEIKRYIVVTGLAVIGSMVGLAAFLAQHVH